MIQKREKMMYIDRYEIENANLKELIDYKIDLECKISLIEKRIEELENEAISIASKRIKRKMSDEEKSAKRKEKLENLKDDGDLRTTRLIIRNLAKEIISKDVNIYVDPRVEGQRVKVISYDIYRKEGLKEVMGLYQKFLDRLKEKHLKNVKDIKVVQKTYYGGLRAYVSINII